MHARNLDATLLLAACACVHAPPDSMLTMLSLHSCVHVPRDKWRAACGSAGENMTCTPVRHLNGRCACHLIIFKGGVGGGSVPTLPPRLVTNAV